MCKENLNKYKYAQKVHTHTSLRCWNSQFSSNQNPVFHNPKLNSKPYGMWRDRVQGSNTTVFIPALLPTLRSNSRENTRPNNNNTTYD